jgi:hypothetical protein
VRETAGAFGAEDAFEQRTVETEGRAISGTAAIDIDGETRIVSFDVGATDNNRDALQSFADAINEADTGITAEVRETASGEVRIRTTRDDTGAEATFDIRDL